jgi:hypothetical protein
VLHIPFGRRLAPEIDMGSYHLLAMLSADLDNLSEELWALHNRETVVVTGSTGDGEYFCLNLFGETFLIPPNK